MQLKREILESFNQKSEWLGALKDREECLGFLAWKTEGVYLRCP